MGKGAPLKLLTTKDITSPALNLLRMIGCNPKEKFLLTTMIFWLLAITNVFYCACSVIKILQQKSLETFAMRWVDFIILSQPLKLLTTKHITSPALNLLRMIGCNPEEKFLLTTMIFWLLAITNVFYVVCLLIKIVNSKQNSLETFAMRWVDFMIISQTLWKSTAIYRNREQYSKVLDVFWNEFWPIDIIPELTNKFNKSYSNVLRGSKIYRGILMFCILQISLFPILLRARVLPYIYYFFGFEDTLLLQSPYYEIAYVIEFITISLHYLFGLIGLDMLFIVLCGITILHFDLLKHALLRLGENGETEDEVYDQIKPLVDYHNLLLQFVQDLDQLFMYPILKQYLDAIACMGIFIYLIQTNFQLLYVFSLMTNMSQTLFFSSFGQFIQDKSFDIADAAYGTKWQLLKGTKVQHALKMVILRAQRSTKISAGGFINLSFESFVGMLKTAGSFLAVMRSTMEN